MHINGKGRDKDGHCRAKEVFREHAGLLGPRDHRAHLRVLSTYMHFTDGLGTPKSLDISAKGFGTNDPMYIVEATRV